MVMQEQERRSPPLEPARTASDELQLPGLDPINGGFAATMAGGGGAGEEERRAEGAPDNVRSPSPWVALQPVGISTSLLSSHIFAGPQFQRKRRSHVPRATPSYRWGFSKLPALLPAPAKMKSKRRRTAKKRDMSCAHCGATKTPQWRTSPTDRRVVLCNACRIWVRTTPGAVLPAQAHVPPPVTATMTVVSEIEQLPSQEIQESESPPDSPISRNAR